MNYAEAERKLREFIRISRIHRGYVKRYIIDPENYKALMLDYYMLNYGMS